MRKFHKASILILTLALVLGLSVQAYAADGSVVYDGSKMTQDFSSDEIGKLVSDLQPGGQADYTVSYENQSGEDTNWYLRNDVIRTLEESSPAENGGYTYVLSFTDGSGKETQLVSNDRYGGEHADSAEPEGLHQATDATNDYFYLTQLAPGAGGQVKLHVGLDGETEVNNYMNTKGELMLQFAVEPVSTAEKELVKKKYITPDTGDRNRLILPALGFAGGLVLLCLTVRSYRRDQKGGDEL